LLRHAWSFFGASSDARKGEFLENFYFWLKTIRAKPRKTRQFVKKSRNFWQKSRDFREYTSRVVSSA
jgi:hypothetical protein